jgi:hypothetical protein
MGVGHDRGSAVCFSEEAGHNLAGLEVSTPLVSRNVIAHLSGSDVRPLPEMRTSPTIMRCTCCDVRLYFRVGLRYRDGEARLRRASQQAKVNTFLFPQSIGT